MNNGKTDMIYGQGHSYGLYWLEQTEDNGGKRQWVQHTIDESFSQSHALCWPTWTATASRSCRGQALSRPQRPRCRLLRSAGHLLLQDQPQDGRVYPLSDLSQRYGRRGNAVCGADCDGDGDVDIAVAGKTGVHFLENLMIDRVPKEQREKEILLDKNWPFPGEGTT